MDTIESGKRLYLDETGGSLNMAPLYGRSQQGERVYDKKPTYPGTSISTVAILSEEGIKARYSFTGSLTAKLFVLYLETSVLPILEDRQTLIMDRHPEHRAKLFKAI